MSSCHYKIFASPPLKMFSLTRDLFKSGSWGRQVKEWLRVLIRENDRLKQEAHPETGLVLQEATSLLFAAAKRLKLPPTVKFLAIDIYQRFIVSHIESVTKLVLLDGGGEAVGEAVEESPRELLARVQKRVGHQAPLRVLTCLWIASKLCTHKRGVTREMIRKQLQESGFEASPKSINKSEIRILETLKFGCWNCSTYPEYVGILTAYLETAPTCRKKIELSDVQLDSLFHTALQVLEFVHLNYSLVYNELFYRVTGLRVVSKKHCKIFARVRCDRMLLASSAVAVGGWILGSDSLFDSVVNDVSPITGIPLDDVTLFATCIVKTLFFRC